MSCMMHCSCWHVYEHRPIYVDACIYAPTCREGAIGSLLLHNAICQLIHEPFAFSLGVTLSLRHVTIFTCLSAVLAWWWGWRYHVICIDTFAFRGCDHAD
jgi:hypothetical protein